MRTDGWTDMTESLFAILRRRLKTVFPNNFARHQNNLRLPPVEKQLRSQHVITFSSNSSQVMQPIDDRRLYKIAALALIRIQMNPGPRLIILFIWNSFLISSSRLRLVLPSGHITQSFPTKSLYLLLFAQMHAICPASLIFSLDMANRIWRGVKSSSLSCSSL